MKKFILSVLLTLGMFACFGEQLIRVYFMEYFNTVAVSEQLKTYLDTGWKIVSMQSISNPNDTEFYSDGLTTTLMVVLERVD